MIERTELTSTGENPTIRRASSLRSGRMAARALMISPVIHLLSATEENDQHGQDTT